MDRHSRQRHHHRLPPPARAATGTAYLGCTPRTYFDNEDASAPTDVSREATGLAEWWACRQGGASEAEVDAKRREIETYLADDEDPGEIEYDEDVDGLDDAEIFVEVKTARFLNALGLPVPDDLPR